MLIKFLAYLPSILGTLLVATFIGLNNHRSRLNQTFLLLTFLAVLWIISLFVADTTSNTTVALAAVRFGVAASTLIGPVFLLFSLKFPRDFKSITSPFVKIVMPLPAVLLAIAASTPYMIQSVSITTAGAQLTNTTMLYTLDVIALVGYFGFGTYELIARRRHSAPMEKTQIDLVLFAVLIVFLTNLVTGYVLTLFNVKGGANLLGSFSVFIFSFVVAYAMLKHRLFDIRLIIVRSLAYILSLGTIGLVAAFILFVISSWLANYGVGQSVLRGFYICIAIILAVIYQPTKRFFDKVTNKFFYRDAYDTQTLIDQLNKLLVSTYDLNVLLRHSSEIIEAHLKPSFCLFAVKATSQAAARLIGGSSHPPFHQKQTSFIIDKIGEHHHQTIVTDDLRNDHQFATFLRDHNVAVAVKLSSRSTHDSLGYLIIGYKKSGNIYSAQDINVIEILANELVIAIENALRFEEIENFNLTLQDRIDDATKKLRKANEKLKEMDETKDDFISMASHQLRTPLTSVKGYLSMVLEGDAGKITHMQQEMLGQAFFSSQRMVYLIADLLNVSRLKTGKFVIEPTPVDLAELVAQELSQLEETAASRSLTLKYDKPKDFPLLMLDETKVRQVIMNFVDNAIYYTPADGHIIVRLIDSKNTIELRVEDDGIGVPKREQAHLFTKFYRAGNARKARPDGTGLGLFMAKKVIVAQEGSIVFESQEGKGSTFGFIFSKRKLMVKPPGTTHTVEAKASDGPIANALGVDEPAAHEPAATAK